MADAGETFQHSEPTFSTWFANDGGPLIVLPRELLAYWDGTDPPSDGRIIIPRNSGFDFAGTDYGRACDAEAEGWATVLAVGPGFGVVVGAQDDAQGVFWLRFAETPGAILIIPIAAEEDSDRLLVDEIRQLSDEDWLMVCAPLRVESNELVLLHAANSGPEVVDWQSGPWAAIGQSIPCHVDPGTYLVEERTITVPTQPDESTFVLCRFKPTLQ